MPLLSLINSRHRFLGYFLRLNSSVNDDKIVVPFTEVDNNVPLVDDYFFEVTLKVPIAQVPLASCICGKSAGSSSSLYRYQLNLLGTSNSIDFIYYGSSFLRLSNFLSDYSGEVVTVRCEWVGNTKNIKVNNIIVATVTNATARPIDHATMPFYVSVFGTVPNRGLDADYYSFNQNGTIFKCNEGSGFDVESTPTGATGTGQTANAGGLTYWDSNVWQKI
tara:strand:+ start:121 stop:780 length:660 start_codon:yes stop_codon:yes gene_type:complete